MTWLAAPAGPGIELARAYYLEVVRPLVAHVPHAAARVGSGSDVLGLDDAQSRDHDWGLRLHLLVDDDVCAALIARLESALPRAFRGHPVRFATTWDAREIQRVEVQTVRAFVESRLGIDVDVALRVPNVGALDWLALTGQSLLEVTAGAVFHDDTGTFTRARAALSWYPEDVWRYVLAAGWSRLAQELPLLGRAESRGDAVGARLLSARLARDLVHLAFLVERRWPPYPKWLAALFARLPAAPSLTPLLTRGTNAALLDAALIVAERQRAHGLPTPPPEKVRVPFFARPFGTVDDGVAGALSDSIVDPALRALPPGLGSIEQWCDNVALLSYPKRRVATARATLAALSSPRA